MMDYVIIGGGAAACVLAERLSRHPDCQVCLLEAGPADTSPLIHVPAGILPLMHSRRLNWALHTTPQSELNGRRLFWPRGKTLGGSTAINAMCCTRGQPQDYDDWAAGDKALSGWNFPSLLPHFRAIEDHPLGPSPLHGEGGPVTISKLRSTNPLSHAFVKAAQEAGLPANSDFNGTQQEGAGFYHVMQRDGQRCSNAHAFLHPALDRPNLHVLTGAQVQRLEMENQHCTAVHYVSRGKHHRVPVAVEALLCAGAIHTPQLLMLSGVGPEQELTQHGIPVKLKLPGVGTNLQDHLDISVIWHEQRQQSISLHPRYWPRGYHALKEYLNQRQGELTSNLAEAGGFVATDPDSARPDVQLHFLPAVEVKHGRKLGPTIRYFGYTLRACLLRPASRGHISLQSAKPSDSPRVDPRYLSEPQDMAGMLRALETAREIMHQPSLSAPGKKEWQPGPGVTDKSAMERDIRHRAESIYHPVGTCRMGSDALAVVDPELRIHGLDNVRVVDASIMPTLISGNTTMPVTAIASRAADLILHKSC